jgi:succinate dehydrogenase/fumarate reductase cytochrome b subunit
MGGVAMSRQRSKILEQKTNRTLKLGRLYRVLHKASAIVFTWFTFLVIIVLLYQCKKTNINRDNLFNQLEIGE